MKSSVKIKYIFIGIMAILMTSCEEFLSEKPDLGLVIPSDLNDFEALLFNDELVFNHTPAIGEIASADYFTTLQDWQNYPIEWERQAYVWADEVNLNGELFDWSAPFEQIFYSNIVLDGLQGLSIPSGETERANRLKGTALFFRAFAYHQLLELFCPYHRFDGEDSAFGLPLRTSSLVIPLSDRARVSEVKSFIKSDLESSLELLPEFAPLKTQPSKFAALALLMRIYFLEGDYVSALEYGKRIENNGLVLIDYTKLPVSPANPFVIFNDEVIFHSQLMLYSFYFSPLTLVDNELLNLYDEDDSRKDIFFIDRGTGGMNFKASHTGRAAWFGGIGTNEVLLMLIECHIRTGDLTRAELLSNLFLNLRIRDFEGINFNSGEEALDFILRERRKELLFRGLRWMDLKRLNYEGFEIMLKRELGEMEFVLSPNSPAYLFPIPPQEIDRNNMIQNPR